MPIKKEQVVAALLVKLNEQLAVAQAAADSAYQGATDSESKAENKYDTRGLEASYLAHGQSKRVLELEAAIADYQRSLAQIQSTTAAPLEAISKNCLVQLTNATPGSLAPLYFYIGPAGGGIKIALSEAEIKVITPEAPVAKRLLGKELEDEVELTLNGTKACWIIDHIS